ncbi:MAG TPA: hypothetical protein VK464_28640 [Symbiobacteriaceae bacterium]|nr:hypothetical protein [Symbiobacteriaceae bacterium]
MAHLRRLLWFVAVCAVLLLALHLPAGFPTYTAHSLYRPRQGEGGRPVLLEPPRSNAAWSADFYVRQIRQSLRRYAGGDLWVLTGNDLVPAAPLLARSWLRSFQLVCFALGAGSVAGLLLGAVIRRLGLRAEGAVAAAVWLLVSGAWYLAVGPGGPGWLLPGLVLAVAPAGYAAHLAGDAIAEGSTAPIAEGLSLLVRLTLFAAIPVELLSRFSGLGQWLLYTADAGVSSAAAFIYCAWVVGLETLVHWRSRQIDFV